jgi:rhodanese-related sulfurtransferase
MRERRAAIFKIALTLALMAVLSINAVADNAPRISKEELKSMLGNEAVIVVDVRTGKDWQASEYKIKGAVRVQPREVESWTSQYSENQTFVFYCASPNEDTSARAALILVGGGYGKVYALKGGWHEWIQAKYPVEEK